MFIEKELDKFGGFIIQQARTNLTKKGNNDTKSLYDSLNYKLNIHKNSYGLYFEMEDYGKFKDKGVQGKSSSAKAPSSPFRFGTGTGRKGGLTESIKDWVKRKRIQFKSRKTGRFLTYDSTAFLITRSIYHKGLAPTNFFSKPFELGFKKLPEELIKAYALDMEKELKKALEI